MRSRTKKGFTLIELLVVIAIIALLLSIVVPGMRMARSHAKKVICRSNMRQIGTAIGAYESAAGFNFRTNDRWNFVNGTGDMPYESAEASFARDLLRNNMLPNRQAFFCPAMRNVSYEKNYLRNRVLAGDTRQYSMSEIEAMMMSPTFSDQPAFWSSFAWLWKKDKTRPGTNILSVNPTSNGVLYVDVPTSVWEMAMGYSNADATMLKNLFNAKSGIQQDIEHFDVLMQDLSVSNPCDKDEDAVRWLWNSTVWGGEPGK